MFPLWVSEREAGFAAAEEDERSPALEVDVWE